MERLQQRLRIAARALSTLEELTGINNPTAVERDAAIQRFEYTFEAVWKAAQRFLLVKEGLSVGSPKACIRTARQLNLLTEEQTRSSLEMTDDRNLTVHTYDESLAQGIFSRLPRHVLTMKSWLSPMQKRAEKD